MLEASEATPARAQDSEWIGAAASLLMTCGLALSGGLLAGSRGTPEPLILVGVISTLFGVITSLVVALAGGFLGRRGWPRALKGARWASTVAALMNVAFWMVALLMARRRYAQAQTALASVRFAAGGVKSGRG